MKTKLKNSITTSLIITHVLILILCMPYACSNDKIKDNKIVVDLNKTKNDSIAFNERYSMIPFSSIRDKYPEYYERILEQYNKPEFDSLIISTFNTVGDNFRYKLYKDNFIGINEFEKLDIDTLSEQINKSQIQLNVGSFFTGNKHIIKADLNNNYDFSDDNSFYFDKDFRFGAKDINIIEKLPELEFKFWQAHNNDIVRFSRKIKIYPSYDEIKDEPMMLMTLEDFWKGVISVDKNKYDFAVQGFNSKYFIVYIKPRSNKFYSKKPIFNYNYSYKLKDTIELDKKLYVLDSVKGDLTKLYLKPINLEYKDFSSDKKGYQIHNVEINGLHGSRNDILELIKESDYTLIDFWGTWCKPCLKVTPYLKEIHKKYTKQLKIISIAYDNDTISVRNYVKNKNMDWFHSIESRNNRRVISKLSITRFPTFILLNSEGIIVKRVYGLEGLKKIERKLQTLCE